MAPKKREDIQGLRAIAVSMVVLFHFYPAQFPNGFIGVDMFFVISGYIIAMVFPQEFSFTNISNFYYRRLKRIFPLYFSMTIIILFTVVFVYPENFAESNFESAKRATMLISNIVIERSDELNYQRLVDNAEDLFTHCWSLCLEIQWYLIAPLIFFFTRHRITFSLAIFGASAFYYLVSDENTRFNCVFARLWQFVIGILAYEMHQKSKDSFPVSQIDLPSLKQSEDKANLQNVRILSYVFLTLSMVGFAKWEQNPHLLRGFHTCVTAMLLRLGADHEIGALRSKIFNFVGDISYSLYLVHWPVYIYVKNSEFLFALPAGIVMSFILALLIHLFFEERYLLWSQSITISFICVSFSISLLISLNGMPVYTIFNPLSAQYFLTANTTFMPSIVPIVLEGSLKNNSNNMGSPLCKYGELFGISSHPPLGHCEMPNGTGSNKILVLGNSWAANQGPSIVYDAFKMHASSFDVYSMLGCEPLQTSPFCKDLPDYGKMAVDYFKPDVLFLVFRAISAKDDINATLIDNDRIFTEFMKHLSYFENYAKKIYIQQDVPSCAVTCSISAARLMFTTGKPLRELGHILFKSNEEHSRKRFTELAKRCKNCELIDYLPYYSTASNGIRGPFDDKRNLIFLDDEAHFNKFGKETLQKVYDDLATEFRMVK